MKTYIPTFFIILASITACGNNKNTGFAGKNMDDIVEIIRDKDSKAAHIEIKKDISWKLFIDTSTDSTHKWEPILNGKGAGVYPLDVPTDTRSYFRITTPKGNAILAERALPMSGAFNFRDLGGYRTQDGRLVKWGKLFRSGEMSNLTEDDKAYLSAIPLVSVVDFRATSEISSAPDTYPQSVENIHAYSITPGNIMAAVNKMPDRDEAVGMMLDANTAFGSDPDIAIQFRHFFTLLGEEEHTPLLFHCTAGKDRTGIAAALILLALGVDEQTVMSDYMLSNKYIKDKYSAMAERYPQLQPLLEVNESYLKTALKAIKECHGSVENFITGTLEVDIPALRKIYLY